jgi:hypothetical protein
MQEIIAGHTRWATASWNRGKLIQDLALFNLARVSACAKRRPQVSVEICRKITTPSLLWTWMNKFAPKLCSSFIFGHLSKKRMRQGNSTIILCAAWS